MGVTAHDQWRLMQMVGFYARIRFHLDAYIVGFAIEVAPRIMLDESTRDETLFARVLTWDPVHAAL